MRTKSARLWLVVAFCFPSIAMATPAAVQCQKTDNVVVLIDRTVSDRSGLLAEAQEVFKNIISDIWSNGPRYFDSKIQLVFLDNGGEHAAAWTVTMPRRFGDQKNKLKAGLSELTMHIQKTIEEIKNDKKAYSQSFLLEGINKQLLRLGDCDKLVIISDMCVVDSSGNNFERLEFQTPKALPRKATVEIHRLGRNGQSLDAIQLIEAWWKDALYGGTAFDELNKKRVTNAKPTSSLSDRVQRTLPKGGSKHRKEKAGVPTNTAKKAQEAPMYLVQTNNAIISQVANSVLSQCISGYTSVDSAYGQYAFKIEVSGSGRALTVVATRTPSRTVGQCFARALDQLTFAIHPKRGKYHYEQQINVPHPQGV
jgi:hypothetical protein